MGRRAQLVSYNASAGTGTTCELMFDASTMEGTTSLMVGAPSKRRSISNSSYLGRLLDEVSNQVQTGTDPQDLQCMVNAISSIRREGV